MFHFWQIRVRVIWVYARVEIRTDCLVIWILWLYVLFIIVANGLEYDSLRDAQSKSTLQSVFIAAENEYNTVCTYPDPTIAMRMWIENEQREAITRSVFSDFSLLPNIKYIISYYSFDETTSGTRCSLSASCLI